MKDKNTYPLVSEPRPHSAIYQKMTAKEAGWHHLNMEARLLKKGETWEGNTGECEFGIVLLSGNYSVTTNHGNWKSINGRTSVFTGIAHTLYLPRNSSFRFVAESDELDLAAGWCIAYDDFPARFKTPPEVAIEIRGGDNATRQINSLIEPGFGSSRLVAVEVYTPAGNWSSYPAHKHDDRQLNSDGELIEACLEEYYFYKFDQEQGYAIQHVYTTDGTLNELMQVRNNNLVKVPRGYHPVSAAPGYSCYYLNFLAGSDQSLANTSDPDHKWMFDSWKKIDERVPVVNANMNNQQL